MRRRISLAVLAALLGFAVGAVCVSGLGTLKMILSPGIHYASFKAYLRAPLLVFMEGLLWSVLGGAIFVLPPSLLLVTIYSAAFKREWMETRCERIFTLGFTAVLWAPIFFFGFRARFLDACLVGVGTFIGVRTGLRFLNQRLHSHLHPSAHQ
jgi:hypothetical protein